MKVRLQRGGGLPQMLQPGAYPHICHSPTLQENISLAQHKSAPHKILLASLAGRGVCLLQQRSPNLQAPLLGMFLPQGHGCVFHRLHAHPLPTNLITLLGISFAWQVADLSF